MKKRVSWLSIVFLIIIIGLAITIKFNGKKVNCNRKTVKVGFYEYYPYYFMNKKKVKMTHMILIIIILSWIGAACGIFTA